MKAPIFIVGPHRSGSTLWHNLVAMCPGVMRLTEPRFLSPPRHKDFRFFLKTQVGDLATDEDVHKMVELAFTKKGLPGLEGAFWRFEGIDAADNPECRKAIVGRIIASDRSLGSIARIFIEELTRFSGHERACVKFPVDVENIPQLLQWFPDCRVMHITRDPRALAMSKSNDPSGTAIRALQHPRLAWLIRKSTMLYSVAQYHRFSRLHTRFKQLRNYRLFRYEDLLADPDRVAKELCEFIDIEFTPDILDLERGHHEHQPSSLTGKRQKGFEPSAAIRWRTKISKFDYAIISILTKGSMKAFEYNPNTHPIFRLRRDVPTNQGEEASKTI